MPRWKFPRFHKVLQGERDATFATSGLFPRLAVPFPFRAAELQYLTTKFSVLRRKSSTISLLMLGRGRVQRTPNTTASVADGVRFIRLRSFVRGSRGMRTSTQLDSPFTCIHWSSIDRNGSHIFTVALVFVLYAFWTEQIQFPSFSFFFFSKFATVLSRDKKIKRDDGESQVDAVL